MKKEVLIAVAVGFILGLIITFGAYTANQALQKQKKPNNSHLPSASIAPVVKPISTLEITEPENNLVVKKATITVSGKTEPKTTVAFLAEDFNNLSLSDEQGLFSAEIPLVSGANEIKIISITKEGEKQEKIIDIVYSTAKIE